MKKETLQKRKISPDFIKKFSGYTEEREAHLDLEIRGEKARKIAEWAEYIKYLSVEKRTEALCIPVAEFNRMMVKPGTSVKTAIAYVITTLKKFGIPAVRVLVSADKVRMWSRTPVKE